MREALMDIFSEYGNVIDIVAKTNVKAKGQAFIVFDSVEAAERAIDEVQGFELFEKSMVLDFAKTRSDATVKATGNDDEFEAHRRRRLAEKGPRSGRRGDMVWFADDLVGREETSARGTRSPEEAEATGGRQRGDRGRVSIWSTRKSLERGWTQVVQPERRHRRPGRISSSQQDPVCPESTR